jgi:hypothetical protein
MHTIDLLGQLSSTDIMGYVACLAVLVTFCMRDMRSLRVAGIIGNVAFIVYAYQNELLPPLLLHMILLPLNAIELARLVNATQTQPKA